MPIDRRAGGCDGDGEQATATSALLCPTISFGPPDACAPAIAADGRQIAFSSIADNLAPGDTNFSSDVFVHRPR